MLSNPRVRGWHCSKGMKAIVSNIFRAWICNSDLFISMKAGKLFASSNDGYCITFTLTDHLFELGDDDRRYVWLMQGRVRW
jgi:hypothetical protein